MIHGMMKSASHRGIRRWTLVCALVAALCAVSRADPVAPGPNDRQIAFAVSSLIRREHLTRHPLDGEVSQRCLKTLLESLDPMKVYFYQSDVDEFNKHMAGLADSIRKGDVTFAYTVFLTFLERIDERVRMVDQILDGPLDFTKDEQMVVDADAAKYPCTPAEAYDRWRKRIKYDLLVLKTDESDGKEGQEARDKLRRRYHSFAKRMHQTNSEELLEIYLNAFTMSFDPHSSYMSPDTLRDFDIMMSLKLEGIGASLQSGDDGYTVIKKIIPGGAADKDGRLKVEDKIAAVGQGADGEMEDVVDMKLRDVVKLIRGEQGTVVRLQVIPADGSGLKTYAITREKIELKDSEAQSKVFPAGKKPDGSPYQIGVIELPSFYRDMSADRLGVPDFKSTTRDVRQFLEDFKRQGADAVVLDLRRNGGGALNEAISLTGLFLKDGPMVQVKDADGFIRPFADPDSGIVWSGPLVVLISKFSASASEILAGAIQDYNRGLVVGDYSTHGKGTVQSLLDIGERLFRVPNSPPLGAFKITMQQFYRPDGESTQKRGVLADVELPSLTTHLDVGEADLDYPIEFDKIPPAVFQPFNHVTPDIRGRLRALSKQRVTNSDDFQKVIRNIARYKEQKDKKYVTLNEEKFLKERAELNADKETEKALEKQIDMNNDGIERDYYLDEALAIAVDYLTLLRQTNPSQEALGAAK
ncbi:MAG: carboxy terminal-processing peptidase [Pirellulales bacterium]|nr:carboxy terminal-processing peptidase [Pirellulales bacterium]